MRPVSQGELLDMDYNCRTGRDRLSFCPSPPKVRRVGNWGPKTEIVKQNIGTWTQSTEWEWDQLPLSPSLFRYAGRVTKTVIDRLNKGNNGNAEKRVFFCCQRTPAQPFKHPSFQGTGPCPVHGQTIRSGQDPPYVHTHPYHTLALGRRLQLSKVKTRSHLVLAQCT